MNSLETSETAKPDPSEPARRSFNWIEILIIPLATCLMEAQPISLTLMLITFPFTGVVNAWPFGEVTITLLLLGLRWWGMFVYALMRRGMSKTEGQPLQVLGLIIALALMIATHPWFVNFIGAAIVGGALIVWFWQRGIRTMQVRDREDGFIQYFKIGFGLLLLEMFVTVFIFGDTLLQSAAIRTFTTFFLSGLLALSFSRLSVMGNTRADNAAQTAATRNWLFALTCIWVLVVTLSLTLEAFSFQFIQTVLQPLWNVLGLLVNAIIYAFFWLFGGLFSWLTAKHMPVVSGLPSNSHPPSVAGTSSIDPQSLVAGRLIVLLLAFALLFVVVIVFLRRWNVRFHEEDEEEVRESLPMREIARERQEEQRRTQREATLEALQTGSVRAQYRDLLQTMAWQKDELARRVEETPNDYKQRVSALLRQSSFDTTPNSSEPPDATVLDELTHAYVEERYGGEQKTGSQPVFTHSWAERLSQRLSEVRGKESQ